MFSVELNGPFFQRLEDKNAIENQAKDHSCEILTKNVASFCLCPEDLNEVD